MPLKSAVLGQKASKGSEEGMARKCEKYEEGPSVCPQRKSENQTIVLVARPVNIRLAILVVEVVEQE